MKMPKFLRSQQISKIKQSNFTMENQYSWISICPEKNVLHQWSYSIIHQFNILRDGKLWTGGISNENYSSFQQIQRKPKLNQQEHRKDGIRRNVAVCRREQGHSTYILKAIRDSSIGPNCLKSSSVTASNSHWLRGEIALHWLLLHALLLFAQLLPFRVRKCSALHRWSHQFGDHKKQFLEGIQKGSLHNYQDNEFPFYFLINK